ncbi:MAG: hypothetical protein DME33_02360, partial [Verrucomicrobia bacterium]
MTNDEGMTKHSVIRYTVTSLHRIYRSTLQHFLGRRSLGEGGNASTACPERQSNGLQRGQAKDAFTLIELIVVVGLILILAGLVLSTAGYARKKGARSRAETEIAAMSAACESYKADYAIYPRDANSTDLLDPTTNGNSSSPSYNLASLWLYEQLSGDLNLNQQPTGKSYFASKPQMLSTDTNGTVLAIKDPFGNSYGYSTRMASTGSG